METLLIFLVGVASGSLTETWLYRRVRRDAAAATTIEDLQQVTGIGPTYASRLQAAGITSLRQLAMTTPEQLFEIASGGRPNARIDADEWVTQAQSIVGV